MIWFSIYLLLGIIFYIIIYRMGSFGRKLPLAISFLWGPFLIGAIIFFLGIHLFPSFILRCLGWKIEGKFPRVHKSIVIVAPHTSPLDAILGKIGMLSIKLPHTILSSSHLFKFPLSPFMTLGLGAIPIGGVPGKNAIHEAADFLRKDEKENHIIICPEGHLRKVEKWNPGFYYMAWKAGVPVVMATLDYKEKVIRFNPNVMDLRFDSLKDIKEEINNFYKNSNPRHPEKFSLWIK